LTPAKPGPDVVSESRPLRWPCSRRRR